MAFKQIILDDVLIETGDAATGRQEAESGLRYVPNDCFYKTQRREHFMGHSTKPTQSTQTHSGQHPQAVSSLEGRIGFESIKSSRTLLAGIPVATAVSWQPRRGQYFLVAVVQHKQPVFLL